MGVFRRKRGIEGLDVARRGEKGKGGGRLPQRGRTRPWASGGPLSSGRRWSRGSLKIQVQGDVAIKAVIADHLFSPVGDRGAHGRRPV